MIWALDASLGSSRHSYQSLFFIRAELEEPKSLFLFLLPPGVAVAAKNAELQRNPRSGGRHAKFSRSRGINIALIKIQIP